MSIITGVRFVSEFNLEEGREFIVSGYTDFSLSKKKIESIFLSFFTTIAHEVKINLKIGFIYVFSYVK